MFAPTKTDGRYPDHITFGWQRSDGDYEIVSTLNGETIENTIMWNSTVETIFHTLTQADPSVEAFQREDVVSVLVPTDDDPWTKIKIW